MQHEWRHFRAGAGPHTYNMAYQVWQPPAAAKGTVICVHGLTRNSHDFDRLAQSLAGDGYRVLVPDIVGRGRSDTTVAAMYNYLNYANDLQLLLRHERVRQVIWIGTSMGGILGMMASAGNQRLVQKLVLNDVGVFIPKAALQRISSYAANPPHFATLAEAEMYCRRVYASFGLTEKADWQVFTQNSVRPVPGASADDYVMAYDPAIMQPILSVPLTDINLWPLWDMNVAPTLVIRGVKSDLLLKSVADSMATCAHAELIEFDGCGHAPSLMVEDQIAVVRQFVAYPHRSLTPWEFAARTTARTARAFTEGFGKLFKVG